MIPLNHLQTTVDDYENGARGSLTGTGVPFVVFRGPWQEVQRRWGGPSPLAVVTATGTLWLRSDGSVELQPGIHSRALRNVLYRDIHAEAYRRPGGIMALQSTAEVTGNIRLQQQAGGRWKVVLEVCPGAHASKYSSEPYCNNHRKCHYDPSFPQQEGHLVGEFHTHPKPDEFGEIRPLSGKDLYQLVFAAMQRVHAYSAIMTAEGVYHAHANEECMARLKRDLDIFYADNEDQTEEVRKALEECRQPKPEFIRQSQTPYLWSLLVGAERFYESLMASFTVATKQRAIDRYIDWVAGNLGVYIDFVPRRS